MTDIQTDNAERIQALKDYLVNGNGLIRILEKETEYYKEMKMKQAEKLVEAKVSIVAKLEEYKEKLISDASFIKRLPADVKERIKQTTVALGTAVDENYREAVKAKEVNRVVLESVSKALMQNKNQHTGYSNEGVRESNPKTPNSAVAINETV